MNICRLGRLALRSPAPAVLGALLATTAVVAQETEDQPPGNLRLEGSLLRWEDNSASEESFNISASLILDGDAPEFTVDVPANSTSYDLSTNVNLCSGRFLFVVEAILPGGNILFSEGLDATVNLCGARAAATSTPLPGGEPAASRPAGAQQLPSTGSDGDSPNARSPLLLLLIGLVVAGLSVLGFAALGYRRRYPRT